jgi:hypothetical protein
MVGSSNGASNKVKILSEASKNGQNIKWGFQKWPKQQMLLQKLAKHQMELQKLAKIIKWVIKKG